MSSKNKIKNFMFNNFYVGNFGRDITVCDSLRKTVCSLSQTNIVIQIKVSCFMHDRKHIETSNTHTYDRNYMQT